MFHIFGALAEFERNLIREHTIVGLEAARARGRLVSWFADFQVCLLVCKSLFPISLPVVLEQKPTMVSNEIKDFQLHYGQTNQPEEQEIVVSIPVW